MPTTITSDRPKERATAPGTAFPVHCPADGRVVGWAFDHDPDQVAAAVHRVRASRPEWEALAPQRRAAWVFDLRDWLFDNEERLAELLRSETGKPWAEASMELPSAIDVLTYYARHAAKFLADSHPRPHGLMTATKRLTVAYRHTRWSA